MQLHLDIPTRTLWGKYFCPNCGNEGMPERVVKFIECITFYNCRNPKCDFSTWDLREYEKKTKKKTRETHSS